VVLWTRDASIAHSFDSRSSFRYTTTNVALDALVWCRLAEGMAYTRGNSMPMVACYSDKRGFI
jgi:hypothetical protein